MMSDDVWGRRPEGHPDRERQCAGCHVVWDSEETARTCEERHQRSGVAHVCAPPALDTWDHDDDDWTCPDCGQAWFVSSKNLCASCHRSDGPEWIRFSTGDGTLPPISVRRAWEGRR